MRRETEVAAQAVFADAAFTAGWTSPYEITPDWNPIVVEVTGLDSACVTTGFSDRGFKLVPTIGEAPAQLVLGQTPRVPIEP